jgi:hypothetical protein
LSEPWGASSATRATGDPALLRRGGWNDLRRPKRPTRLQDAETEPKGLQERPAANARRKTFEELPAGFRVDLDPQIGLMLWKLEVALAAVNQEHTEDPAACETAKRLLISAFAKLETRAKKATAAREAPVAGWQIDLDALAAEVKAAREKLCVTIKSQQERRKKIACTVIRRVVDRLTRAAQGAVQSEDLVDTYCQLLAKVSEMEKAVMSVEGSMDPLNEAKLREAEASLRELERRRQWLRKRISGKPRHNGNVPQSGKQQDDPPAPPVTSDVEVAMEAHI